MPPADGPQGLYDPWAACLPYDGQINILQSQNKDLQDQNAMLKQKLNQEERRKSGGFACWGLVVALEEYPLGGEILLPSMCCSPIETDCAPLSPTSSLSWQANWRRAGQSQRPGARELGRGDAVDPELHAGHQPRNHDSKEVRLTQTTGDAKIDCNAVSMGH